MLVKINNLVGRDAEWCILEFQGEMIAEELAGEELGQLDIFPNQKADMVIGQHFLEGSVVKLKAPYLLVDEPETDELFGPASEREPRPDKELVVRGIVRQKVIFKTRPKPVGLKRPREESNK